VFFIAAIVFFLVLPDPWNLFVGTACLVLGLGELAFWNRKVRDRRRVVGPQTLIGKIGTVRETCRPVGQVFVDGELWSARCGDGADVGQNVKVLAVRGLELEVRAES
jgi:membrane protein implicated in regulation of membrane protease activity